MRISDWSSDVCSSDLPVRVDFASATLVAVLGLLVNVVSALLLMGGHHHHGHDHGHDHDHAHHHGHDNNLRSAYFHVLADALTSLLAIGALLRSEEHTSELQSLMRNSYAVFCLKKKKK